MRLRRFALAGALGAAVLTFDSLALAQDDAPADRAAAPGASSVEIGGASVLLGPGEEGIGPLASARVQAQPPTEASAPEGVTPDATPEPQTPKAPAARPRLHGPAKAVRRSRRHNES